MCNPVLTLNNASKPLESRLLTGTQLITWKLQIRLFVLEEDVNLQCAVRTLQPTHLAIMLDVRCAF